MPRVRMERKDNFYFLSFAAFSCLSSLGMKPQWYFWIFWIFFPFFWNFLSRLGYEWNGRIIFIFSFSQHFPAYFHLKWSHNSFFKFFEFISYLFGIFYYISGRNVTERNDNFYFSLSNQFPTSFGLKRIYNGIF